MRRSLRHLCLEVADTAMHMEIISILENSRVDRIYENNLSS